MTIRKLRCVVAIALLSTILPLGHAFAAYRPSSGESNYGSGTSTMTVNAPAGVQAGDLVVIMGYAFGESSSYVISSSGFTAGYSDEISGPALGPNCTLSIIWKVATGSEPSTYTVSIGDAPEIFLIDGAWENRNTSSPFVIHVFTAASGSASPVTFNLTGGTADAGDDVIWAAITNGPSSAPSWTPPSSYTTGVAAYESSSYPGAYFAYRNDVSSGATGTLSGTETGVGTDQIGFVISLAAAASGPPPSQFFFSANPPMPHPADVALALPAWIIEQRRRLVRRS